MTSIMKSFLALALTFIITRLSFRFFSFDPFTRFSFWPGFIIDLGIWLIVFYICSWVINKISAKTSKKS